MAPKRRSATLPRYCAHRSLPPYAFVPGVHPHPTRSPEGHSYGRTPEPLESAFAWGVDLYNHGYLWEAHEAWEDLWHAAGSDDARAALFRGLIQCAAAALKVRQGRLEGARRVSSRGMEHLQRALQADVPTEGLDLPVFVRRYVQWLGTEPVDADGYPRIVLAR